MKTLQPVKVQLEIVQYIKKCNTKKSEKITTQKSATWKWCSMKKVQQTECNMKKVQHEKILIATVKYGKIAQE